MCVDWNQRLQEIGDRVGFEIVEWAGKPAKRQKVLLRCEHGERWVFPHGVLNVKSCCRSASKLADKNPAFGKPNWNSGTVGVSTGHGFGGKPKGELAVRDGILYFVETCDGLKVGITCQQLNRRFAKYELKRVIAQHTAPLGKCFVAEQAILAEAKLRGWRQRSSRTTELIHPDGYSEVKEWVLRGGLGDSQV